MAVLPSGAVTWIKARCPSSAERSSRLLRRWFLPSTKSSAWTRTAASASAISNLAKHPASEPPRAAMKTDLRLTDPNAASDSKGRTWGLEGGLFWWLVGGIGVGITVFFVLLVVLKSSLTASFGVAILPVGLCLAYIFGLKQGKPPGYDRDCFEHWLSNGGFGPETQPARTLRHPLSEEHH